MVTKGAMAGLAAWAVLLLAGCATPQGGSMNPFTLQKENSRLRAVLRQQQEQIARVRDQATNLDQDNEQLHNLLAQEQAAAREMQAELERALVAESSLAALDNEPKEFGPATDSSPSAANAVASRQPAGAQWLPIADIPGAELVRDGETMRIRMSGGSLFSSGRATLKPGARAQLDRIATAIVREYPGNLICIEGHTDTDPIRKSTWKNNHELSVMRSMAVYDYLKSTGIIPESQMFVAGFGSNLPIASNRSLDGKARNRRVEFVILPTDARVARDNGLTR